MLRAGMALLLPRRWRLFLPSGTASQLTLVANAAKCTEGIALAPVNSVALASEGRTLESRLSGLMHGNYSPLHCDRSSQTGNVACVSTKWRVIQRKLCNQLVCTNPFCGQLDYSRVTQLHCVQWPQHSFGLNLIDVDNKHHKVDQIWWHDWNITLLVVRA